MELDAFVLVIILTSGFIYTSKAPECKFTLYNIMDWIQYLYIFTKGIRFAFVSFLIIDFVYWLSEKIFIEALTFNVALWWSFLSIVCAEVSGCLMSKDEGSKNRAIKKNSEEDSFREKIYDAVVDPKFVQVTLNTGQVYVGMVLSQTELSKPSIKYLKICPALSGYREREKQILIFTNNYWKNYKEIFIKYVNELNGRDGSNQDISDEDMLSVFRSNETNIKDISVLLDELEKFMTVISLEHIVSISNFNIDLYLKINSNNNEVLGTLS